MHGNPASGYGTRALLHSLDPRTLLPTEHLRDFCFALLWHRGRLWAAFRSKVRILSDGGEVLRSSLSLVGVRTMVAAPSGEVFVLCNLDTYDRPRVEVHNEEGDHLRMAYLPVKTGGNRSHGRWYESASACALDSAGNLLLAIERSKSRSILILKQALDLASILNMNQDVGANPTQWEWCHPDVNGREHRCYGRLAVHNDDIFISAHDCMKVLAFFACARSRMLLCVGV